MIIFITILLLIVASLPSGLTEVAKLNDSPYTSEQTKNIFTASSIITILTSVVLLLLSVIIIIKRE